MVGLSGTVSFGFGQMDQNQTGPVISHPAGDFVTVGSHKIWYESEGQGEPLLLIPGGPGSSHDYFHPFFSALSNQYRVIYYDPFGTGKSDHAKNPSEYSLKQEIEEVEELRKALGIDQWNVFGHSWGGVVAQGYVTKYPGPVKKVVLSDCLVSGKSYQDTNDRALRLMADLFPDNWKKMEELHAKGLKSTSSELSQAEPDIFAIAFFYQRENTSKLVPAGENTMNPEISIAIMGKDMDFKLGGEAANFDWHAGLRSLRVPILIVNGRADLVVTPRQAEELASAAPGAKLVIFEHSGHMSFAEETAGTMKTIGDFLSAAMSKN
jgi:proline iminopeptidase